MERDGSTPQQAILIPGDGDEQDAGIRTSLPAAARQHSGRWLEAEVEEARGGFTVLVYNRRIRNRRFPHLQDGVYVEVCRYQDDQGYLLKGQSTRPTAEREQLNCTKRYKRKSSAYAAAQRFLKDTLAFLGDVWRPPRLSLDQVRALLLDYDGSWFTADLRAEARREACKMLHVCEGLLGVGELPPGDHLVLYERLAAGAMLVPTPQEAEAKARRYLWMQGEQEAPGASSAARDYLAVFEGLVEPSLVDAPPVAADEEFPRKTWRKALEAAGEDNVCFMVRVYPDGTPALFSFTGGEMDAVRARLGDEEE